MTRHTIRTKEVILSKAVHAFIPVKVSTSGQIDERNYMVARREYEDPDLRTTIVERAYDNLQSWISRYERDLEFNEVFSPVIEAYKSIDRRVG
jgi:hypothetical protein